MDRFDLPWFSKWDQDEYARLTCPEEYITHGLYNMFHCAYRTPALADIVRNRGGFRHGQIMSYAANHIISIGHEIELIDGAPNAPNPRDLRYGLRYDLGALCKNGRRQLWEIHGWSALTGPHIGKFCDKKAQNYDSTTSVHVVALAWSRNAVTALKAVNGSLYTIGSNRDGEFTLIGVNIGGQNEAR